MPISKFISKTEPDWSKLSLIGLSLFIVAILVRLIFLWISLTNLPVTSDEASSVLLAKMIFRGELPLLFVGQPYQFPIESYLMAPFVEWMPRTPFGARYQAIILGFAAFWGFFAIIRRAFLPGSRWPAILLVCFPSAYFLIFLAAYAPPQYSISLTLTWVSILAVLRSRQNSRRYLFLMIAGLSCGLAVSNHLLTVTISAGVLALVFFSGSARKSLQETIVFTFCCLLGALPYILAIWFIPGAYKNLPSSMELFDTLSRMIFPALTITLPGAMGVNPILFPDLAGQINWPASLRSVFAIFYSSLFLSLIVQRLKLFFSTVVNRQWPRLELVDLALITSLLSLWVFASHFTASSSYRYVLPAVWCFPFLIGHAFQSFSGRYRISVGVAAVCLALFNIGVSINVMYEWSDSEKLEKYAQTPRIEALVDTLRDRDISHCYASFWVAYRITFETDEEIVCSLPYNQRFPFWPIPYMQQVEDQTDSVYILTQRFHPRLPAKIFEKHLKSHQITAEKTTVGPFFIYHDFQLPAYSPDQEHILGLENYTIQTSGGNAPTLITLSDRDFSTAWVSSDTQAKGQWVTLTFDSIQSINGVTLFHLPNDTKNPKSFRIDGYITVAGVGTWYPVTGPVETKSERIRFVNNHPVYSGISQQMRFDPVEVEALRIEIVEADKESRWGLAEIEVSALKERL